MCDVNAYKEMSCFAFALGAHDEDTRKLIDKRFTLVSNYFYGLEKDLPGADLKFFGPIKDKCKGKITQAVRDMILLGIVYYSTGIPPQNFTIGPPGIPYAGGSVFGGFGSGTTSPEHMWIRPQASSNLLDTVTGRLISCVKGNKAGSDPALTSFDPRYVSVVSFRPGFEPFLKALADYAKNSNIHAKTE